MTFTGHLHGRGKEVGNSFVDGIVHIAGCAVQPALKDLLFVLFFDCGARDLLCTPGSRGCP